MKPIIIDKQSVLDAACMLIGSAIGASATVALFVYAWTRKPIQGDPTPGGRP
jgi:hypothetical protein